MYTNRRGSKQQQGLVRCKLSNRVCEAYSAHRFKVACAGVPGSYRRYSYLCPKSVEELVNVRHALRLTHHPNSVPKATCACALAPFR